MPTKTKRVPREIGWREWIDLPDIGLTKINAKIDTGARTSAIHASDISTSVEDGVEWVEFSILTGKKSRTIKVREEVVDRRPIKNTSGKPQIRIIIKTTLQIGDIKTEIEVSLADRGNMAFPMIIGRTAIRGRKILVNPSFSYLGGRPLIPSANQELKLNPKKRMSVGKQ